jgi:16S rRNA (uracil1498-N3)-methyltransferase
MQIFYAPDISGDEYVLNEEESKHCIRVLRKQKGDLIHLIDGFGGFYIAEITEEHPKHTSVRVIERKPEFGKRNYYLHMAIGPTKNIARMEWFLEKATEIGIDEITFIQCQNSERTVIKPERLEKIITSAVKQSVKAYHPKLNELQSFKAFMKSMEGSTALKFIAHCREGEKKTLWNEVSSEREILILIGPEGDSSTEEIEMAEQKGFQSISLGSQRFRTETAALVACHTVNLRCEY